MIRVAEGFAGIGGFRKGLEEASSEIQSFPSEGRTRQDTDNLSRGGRDWESAGEYGQSEQLYFVWANDIDKYASAIYRYQYQDGIHVETDIKTIDPESIPDHDLFTFGWPCQDNSIAGQRAGQREGTRSGLLFEALRILRAKKPRYFLAENVPGLFSVNEGYDFYATIRLFTEAGYDVQWQVLNTRWFLPQNRERIFFVGHLRGQRRPEAFPLGETGGKADGTDGAGEPESVCYEIDANYGKGCHAPSRTNQRTMVIQSGHRAKGGARLYEGEIPAMTQDYGTGGGNVPLVIARGPDDSLYARDDAPTLGSGTGHMMNRQQALVVANAVDPDGYRRIRRLTPTECERLQGYPDGWTKYGLFNGHVKEISDTQRYKCCGNAVTVNVIKAIGVKLLKSLEAHNE